MLVLSRKKKQSIRIGEDIEITVLEVRADRVRLGIAAPREVRVMRAELLSNDPAEITSPDADEFVVLAEECTGDTLRSGSARNHTQKKNNSRPSLPR